MYETTLHTLNDQRNLSMLDLKMLLQIFNLLSESKAMMLCKLNENFGA